MGMSDRCVMGAAGNAWPVPLVSGIIRKIAESMGWCWKKSEAQTIGHQPWCFPHNVTWQPVAAQVQWPERWWQQRLQLLLLLWELLGLVIKKKTVHQSSCLQCFSPWTRCQHHIEMLSWIPYSSSSSMSWFLPYSSTWTRHRGYHIENLYKL